MKLVVNKSGSGWEWVVEKSTTETTNAEFLGCAESLKNNDAALLGMTVFGRVPETDPVRSSLFSAESSCEKWGARFAVPEIFAVADPCQKWWERLRGNPKRAGEISQAAFLLKAEMMGFHLALPWGDSERYDFVVWSPDGRRIFRVQVKGTGRLHRRGYEVQPVHTTRKGGKKRYTKKDIDIIAAHVQPLDTWYLIPIEKVGRAKSLRLYPDREREGGAPLRFGTVRKPKQGSRRTPGVWEQWKDAWEVLGGV